MANNEDWEELFKHVHEGFHDDFRRRIFEEIHRGPNPFFRDGTFTSGGRQQGKSQHYRPFDDTWVDEERTIHPGEYRQLAAKGVMEVLKAGQEHPDSKDVHELVKQIARRTSSDHRTVIHNIYMLAYG